MKKILVIVHQQTSDTGRVGQISSANGYTLDIRVPSIGEELPPTMDEHVAAIIFGGPMSANDEESLPYIRTELNWISVVLESGKPFLGICLGAQLLAKALGAKVVPHPQGIREIGYYAIAPTQEGKKYFNSSSHYVYHWHQEGFELPSDAVRLAEGTTFPNQAFRYGNAYGFQFHPEMTTNLIKKWLKHGAAQLTLPGAQSRTEQLILHERYGRQGEEWLKSFLGLWFKANKIASVRSQSK